MHNNMNRNIDKQIFFDHDELVVLKADYESVIQDKTAHNPQFKNRRNRYNFYLVAVGILTAIQLVLVIWLYQLAARLESLLTSQLIVQRPYLPAFIIGIRIFAVIAMSVTIIGLIATNYWKNLDKNHLRHFATTPIAFDQKQDYKQIRIQQMIKLPDYLILIANKKRFKTSNGNSRCLVLRKQNNQTLYQQLIDNYRQNILKRKKMRRWVDYYLIDATGEMIK